MPTPNSRYPLGRILIECLEDRVCPSYLYTHDILHTAPAGQFTYIRSWSVNSGGDVAFVGVLPFTRPGEPSGPQVYRVTADSGNAVRLSEGGNRVQIDDSGRVVMALPIPPQAFGTDVSPEEVEARFDAIARQGTVRRFNGGFNQYEIISTARGIGTQSATTRNGQPVYFDYTFGTNTSRLAGAAAVTLTGQKTNFRLAVSESGGVIFKDGLAASDPIRVFGGDITVAGGQTGFTVTGASPASPMTGM